MSGQSMCHNPLTPSLGKTLVFIHTALRLTCSGPDTHWNVRKHLFKPWKCLLCQPQIQILDPDHKPIIHNWASVCSSLTDWAENPLLLFECSIIINHLPVFHEVSTVVACPVLTLSSFISQNLSNDAKYKIFCTLVVKGDIIWSAQSSVQYTQYILWFSAFTSTILNTSRCKP